MGHHLVWTTHELLLGINTPKKMPVDIPVVHDQYHHSVLVNWDPFPWWIYLFWWPFPKSIPYISPWKTLGLLKELEKKSASSGFPMGKNKNIFIKSRKITDEIPTSLISAGCQHVSPDVAKAAEPERLRVVPSWHCESVRACATAQLDPAEILLLSGKNIRIY